ncbi:MAG: flavin reductase family protein [Rhodobacteraceae bacterium]|nr:flavin reductase family protein [Paracoccaceae bacterium]
MNAQAPIMPQIFTPGPDNTRLLRDAFGRFATGVTVVTASSRDGPVGITANSFSSVSLDPALVLWASGRASKRFSYFADASHFAIHVLAADQADVCETFTKNGFAFSDVAHDTNVHGVPLVSGCLVRFECKCVAQHDGGDHVIIVGEVEKAELGHGESLAFFAGRYGQFVRS